MTVPHSPRSTDPAAGPAAAAPPSPDSLVAALVRDARDSNRLRAGSFIITAFGDVVAPRGGTVSLASLIRFLAPFGVNDSQVRTAVSRLSADGWLRGSRRGRNSFYGLTESGARRFAAATRRIYDAGELEWEGRWQVVICPEAGPAREALRRELGWAGFGVLAPGLFLHPNPPDGAAEAALDVLGLAGRVLMIDGRRALAALPATLHLMAGSAWALDGLADAYAGFADRYAPLAAILGGTGSAPPVGLPQPAAALQARVLLIHDYRRALLRDPLLPSDFLPADWPGRAARRRAQAIYRALAPAAEAGIDLLLDGPDGPLPPPSDAFRQRFGGIAD